MNIEGLLSAGDPMDLCEELIDLLERLEERVHGNGPDALAEPVKTAYFVLTADSAMNNNGPIELLDGPLSGHTRSIVGALRQMGAGQMAELLERALAEPEDPAHLDAWARYPDELEVTIVDWVRTHKETFLAT